MKKHGKLKIIICASVLTLGFFSIDHQYHPNIEILDYNEAFASYSEGLVYIGDEDYLDSIIPCDGDILVCDERDSDDPNMKIIDSYKVQDKDLRNEILEILEEYEREYPSDWDRSIEAMRLEWFCHNFSYCVNNETKRAKDVDLNNEEEEIYSLPIVNKLLKL
jgi:hypothetical protein